MPNIKVSSVDEYISIFSPDIKKLLKTLRKVIIDTAPDAEEVIGYNMPAYKYYGIFVYFAAHKNHIGFYPGSALVIEVFRKELAGYQTSKGTIQLPLDKLLPISLIKKIVRFRVKFNLDKHKSKLKKKRPN
ncbi:MAG: hypothetical protein GYA14_01980 [Ignavibacteria bacterium]|nr:hypothetical protein [Ignavibacteria bacterium]